MIKLNITKLLDTKVRKLADLEGYHSLEEYIVEKLILLVVNEVTYPDVESTKKKIKVLQEELSKKQQTLMGELREEGGKD